MSDTLATAIEILRRIDLRAVLDIALIAGATYWLLLWLRGTSAMSLIRGIAIVAAVAIVLGDLLNLTVVNWLLRNSLTALLVAIPIIFQPELRRALERVGRTGMRSWRNRLPADGVQATVADAARQCSRLHFGALIVLERETGLQDYVDTGVRIDALPSVPLLTSIFFPNSPLHDGAIIISEGRVAAAGCTLPLAEPDASVALGTRHRAALGISERTDALVIVASEETGEISVASNGQFVRAIDPDQLAVCLAATASGAKLVPGGWNAAAAPANAGKSGYQEMPVANEVLRLR